MSFNNKRDLKKIITLKREKMSAFFISIAIIVVALIAAICFMVAELFWPFVAIIVIILLWKLVSQRKNECISGKEKPFDREERD